MLKIKRVATVLSNYQEKDKEEDCGNQIVGCGNNCLGKCCLPLSKLPLYTFKNDEADFIEAKVVQTTKEETQAAFLNILLGQWEDRRSRGLFRYDVTTCETKVIPGSYGFIAQFNEGRHLQKRATEFRIDQVLQPFDKTKFNFTKVGQEEVLFRFDQSNNDNASYFFNKAPTMADSSSPSVIAINVSPIEYGHVLLIPRVLDCLPQRIDDDSIWLALHMAREAADPFFRVGYNSLGAFATINHLHFQAYYLAMPFPVEKVPTRRISTTSDSGVIVSHLLNYPVRGFVFEGGYTLRDLSNVVASSCIYLQNNNIPFNILITDCGQRILLFPQCYAEKQALGQVSTELLDTQVNPAAWEISGHMVLKRRKDYEEASDEYALKLLAEVSLSDSRFQQVKVHLLKTSGLQEIDVDESKANHEEGTSRATHIVAQDCMVQF